MAIKIKHKDPKSTDFGPNDIVINVKEGTLFYKSEKNIFKLTGDNLNTKEDLIIWDSNISASKAFFATPGLGQMAIGSQDENTFEIGIQTLEVGGHITPIASEAPLYDLGSFDKPWRDVYYSQDSLHFVKKERGIGYSKIGGTFKIDKYGYQTAKLESTTFTKQDIDDLKEGKPISKEKSLTIEGSITASGLISSSQTTGTNILGTDLEVFGRVRVHGSDVTIENGHITASGAISSSGIITAKTGSYSHIITHGNTIEFQNASSKAVEGYVKFDTTNGLQIQDASRNETKTKIGFLNVTGYSILQNITSSGTISASGMIQTAGAISSSTGITSSHALFSGNVTASGAISSSGVITATSHISTSGDFYGNNIGPIQDNYIYLTPNDFYPDNVTDYSRTRAPGIAGDGAYLADGGSAGHYYAMKVIPKGYKATHTIVYSNNPAADTFTTYSSSIAGTGAGIVAGECGSSTSTNTEKDITDIAGGSGVYCILMWDSNATARLYGARITLAVS